MFVDLTVAKNSQEMRFLCRRCGPTNGPTNAPTDRPSYRDAFLTDASRKRKGEEMNVDGKIRKRNGREKD